MGSRFCKGCGTGQADAPLRGFPQELVDRPLAGFAPDHPLRLPYHLQFASAFVLREYVFDLVDHMARARSAQAARLAPGLPRA